MSFDYDICIIGSGAGAGPVAYELSRAGYQVVVLEKGPWFKEEDFYKDELACCRRSVYTPKLKDEPHVIEDSTGQTADGKVKWKAESNAISEWDFWNGNCVGGSSNFMSGYFYRLKPVDFRLLSEYGPIQGANIVDWPISYADMEPYYTKVESVVGVSGKVVKHPKQEPRSTKDFPYKPTAEHAISKMIDSSCKKLGLHSLPVARAVLSRPDMKRRSCEYSGFCGSYGCSTGAKGSARAALLDHAVRSGRCKIIPYAKAYKLSNNAQGKVTHVEYFDKQNKVKKISARIYVVACLATESARLLLMSNGPAHSEGLGNRYDQVGKNLLFSAGGSGYGEFYYDKLDKSLAQQLRQRGPFVNRGLQDWYEINDSSLGGKLKGGTIDFLLNHPNAISRAYGLRKQEGKYVWGDALKQALEQEFINTLTLRFEIFLDWLPTRDCFVALDGKVKDKWGSPVGRIRVGYHKHDLKIGNYMADKAELVLKTMGAQNINRSISGSPPSNLVAGGCRFGTDPHTSVLDVNCRIHDVDNVYVTDGSFMPTGGSVPYTWTIYANSFRVADKIIAQLGGRKL